ncbi:hypothetical protein [Kibdelosporangium phytohabitans]|uniref:hypothetical protein n=1 Tax=Kibdelosporangium phytohabitans TaxID=860235 RepID=UPI0012F91917|nr:hypothetical protein [Kibdelosporangium phytohabitans]MBE1465600.1 hypothetical protein [Kibdelosporangium phytohabitans]
MEFNNVLASVAFSTVATNATDEADPSSCRLYSMAPPLPHGVDDEFPLGDG